MSEPRPPPGKRKLARTHEPFGRLTVSLPGWQLEQLHADAQALGVSVSEVMRRILSQPTSRVGRSLPV